MMIMCIVITSIQVIWKIAMMVMRMGITNIQVIWKIARGGQSYGND